MNVPGWDYGPTADYARQGRGEHTRIVTPSGTAERVFHEESGRILAALNRACGDFDLAEEAMQEAFAVAVERWPRDGVPSNPGAWITTTARRKTIDRLRRDQTIAQKRHLLETDVALDALAQDEDVTRVSELLDDRLRLTSPAAIRRSRGTRRSPSRCERSADSRRRKSRELFSCPEKKTSESLLSKRWLVANQLLPSDAAERSCRTPPGRSWCPRRPWRSAWCG